MNHVLAGLVLVCIAGAARGDDAPVSAEEMQRIYDEVKTPFKYGIILAPPAGQMLDCPSVFRHGDRWYMVYIRFDNVGYTTELAVSDDLLNWTPLGSILSPREGKWDAKQAAGYVALQNFTWGGSYALRSFDGKYWMSYLGGALEGYETDPLSIGVAMSESPDRATEWSRPLDRPVLAPDDAALWWDNQTLYKSHIIEDPDRRAGRRFVMYYNAKGRDGAERIGMAVSDDMLRWDRFGDDPVIDNGRGISGDPQITRIGDLWVMFYFGAFWKPKAFDTFAASRDLIHWTKWDGPHLVQPSEPWDDTYAHKPWVIKHDGMVYHFYCAVGDQGRVIALATSRDLRATPK